MQRNSNRSPKKTGLNVIKFIYYKLSYIQDQCWPVGIHGIGAEHPIWFGRAGEFPSPCVLNSTLLYLLIGFIAISLHILYFLLWVSSGPFGLMFPLVGSVTLPGWMPLRVVMVMRCLTRVQLMAGSSWLASPASEAAPPRSSVDEFNSNFVAHCFIM